LLLNPSDTLIGYGSLIKTFLNCAHKNQPP
jgi:hypothetical protein